MNTPATLNLSRKWRSKQFDAVIGQELSVRILLNSLYVNQFFPVYLFSGQRGCGKTTSARLFAAAVNCEALALFQQKPREYKVPCLSCSSCKAMTAGNHPDFVEIDAASHTGVDNVRTIIESASLMPVLGRKKVYLIDEAHMLSKAAFNAFLKILEEPPASVLFMLATTDPHKIIDTVRSRCFQLFFTAIAPEVIAHHLEAICVEEKIQYDRAGLVSIASETEGSARDAINLLEQVRFSSDRVTAEAVLALLGHLPEKLLIELFEKIIAADVQAVIALVQTSAFERCAPLSLWQKSCELVRALLFIKQGVQRSLGFQDQERLLVLAKKLSEQELVVFLQQLYRYEQLLLKSTVQSRLLELLFIELTQRSLPQQQSPKLVRDVLPSSAAPKMITTLPVAAVPVQQQEQPVVAVQAATDSRWDEFAVAMSTVSDPLLQTIFKQLRFVRFDEDRKKVLVTLTQESTIFTQWLQEGKAAWSPLLERCFGVGVALEVQFDRSRSDLFEATASRQKAATPLAVQKVTPEQANFSKVTRQQAQPVKKEQAVDVSDSEKWQKAHYLQGLFGGSVVNVPEEETTHDKAE